MAKECLDEKTKEQIKDMAEDNQKIKTLIGMIPTCKVRKKSEYQMFISKCMTEHKDEYKGKPFGAAGNVMRTCAAQWTAQKK